MQTRTYIYADGTVVFLDRVLMITPIDAASSVVVFDNGERMGVSKETAQQLLDSSRELRPKDH